MKHRTARFLRGFYLFALAGTVVTLGAVYAIHNTDPHHWGFVLGTALDFIHGRELFTEVYVQYGAGLPLLFKAINSVWPITYTNIGFLTSAVYAATLVVLFLSVERLSSTTYAVLLTVVAFFFHPYAIFPWPDYYAGLCLILACYCLLPTTTESTKTRGLFAGVLLFLAFLFRNTYLFNLLAGAGAYFVLSLRHPRLKDARLTTAIATFLTLTALYFFFLAVQQKLHLWYRQDLGAATSTYAVGAPSVKTGLIRLFSPFDLWTLSFTAAWWINVYIFFAVVRGLGSGVRPEPLSAGVTLFVAVLGLTGVVQGLMLYEPFRLQNASIPLYLGLAYLLSRRRTDGPKDTSRLDPAWVLAALILAFAFRTESIFTGHAITTIWPLIEEPRDFLGKPLKGDAARTTVYAWSEGIPIFKGHRFLPDVQNYYRSLSSVLCASDNKIVNLTNDSMVPYLCPGPRNALYLPMYPFGLLDKISPEQLSRVIRGQYEPGELIVSDAAPRVAPNIRLREIAAVPRPYQVRWTPRNVAVEIFLVEPRETTDK